ncbi:hypothetical protein ACTQ6A_04505 [Lachnospiraceae bacterium LCP25S3_G4]
MYEVKCIGKIKVNDNQTEIHIEYKYKKAMKHLDQFSHIHIFFIANLNSDFFLERRIVEIKAIDFSKGIIMASVIDFLDEEIKLVDIKPYFPSEDTVKIQSHSMGNMDNTVIAIEHNKQFVKHCTWKIELGSGAGKQGGNVINQGYNMN